MVMALAMLRVRGNITKAARTLVVSRKMLRDNLRRAGLYPWHEQGETSYRAQGETAEQVGPPPKRGYNS